MATKKKNLKKPSAKATQSAPATGTATAQPQAQPDPTALSIGDLKKWSIGSTKPAGIAPGSLMSACAEAGSPL